MEKLPGANEKNPSRRFYIGVSVPRTADTGASQANMPVSESSFNYSEMPLNPLNSLLTFLGDPNSEIPKNIHFRPADLTEIMSLAPEGKRILPEEEVGPRGRQR